MAIIKGEKFEAMTVPVSQDRIDSNKVKELLTPEQLLGVVKTITFTQIKCARHTGEKPKFVMPNFGNATPEGLVDMLGEVREQIKDLQKLEGLYKDALDARLKD